MKYLSIVIFLFIISQSCRTKGNTTVHSNELIEKFKPFLNGTWVPADYINDIVKTKSPFKSSGKITYISEFSIDATKLSDSINIGAAMGNHEGGDFILHFKPGLTPASLPVSFGEYQNESSFYELGYVITSIDTSLELYHYDKNKKLLDKTKYMKVQAVRQNDDLGDGFQYMVNRKLLARSYNVSDSNGKETRVELTTDGKIKGFMGFKTYYIITDFAAGPENANDEICFDIQTKDQKCYGFKIIADTINLFEAAKDEEDTLFKPGQTIYKFIRQY
jgi:hypothetical protein